MTMIGIGAEYDLHMDNFFFVNSYLEAGQVCFFVNSYLEATTVLS